MLRSILILGRRTPNTASEASSVVRVVVVVCYVLQLSESILGPALLLGRQEKPPPPPPNLRSAALPYLFLDSLLRAGRRS
jgi:hypothetical protein